MQRVQLRPPFLHLLAVVLLICMPLRALAGAGDLWEQVLEADGITVHRRPVAGSHLVEFIGRGVIDAPPSRVIAIIRDASHYSDWLPRCKESRQIDQVGPRAYHAYLRTSAKWPVQDRDVVLRGELKYDADAAMIEYRGVAHPGQPPVRNVVRMPLLEGYWRLEPVDGGRRTMLEYLARADSGGIVPAWIVNIVSRRLPYWTIVALREWVQRKAYPDYEQALERDAGYVRFLRGPASSTGEGRR